MERSTQQRRPRTAFVGFNEPLLNQVGRLRPRGGQDAADGLLPLEDATGLADLANQRTPRQPFATGEAGEAAKSFAEGGQSQRIHTAVTAAPVALHSSPAFQAGSPPPSAAQRGSNPYQTSDTHSYQVQSPRAPSHYFSPEATAVLEPTYPPPPAFALSPSTSSGWASIYSGRTTKEAEPVKIVSDSLEPAEEYRVGGHEASLPLVGSIQRSYPSPQLSYPPSPSNYPSAQPSYSSPPPNYQPPQSSYPSPRPSYRSLETNYPTPQPTFSVTKHNIPSDFPNYPTPKPSNASPQPSYQTTQPSYPNILSGPSPQPAYPAAQPSHLSLEPSYLAAQPSYPAPQLSYPGAQFKAPGSPYLGPGEEDELQQENLGKISLKLAPR